MQKSYLVHLVDSMKSPQKVMSNTVLSSVDSKVKNHLEPALVTKHDMVECLNDKKLYLLNL